MISLKKRDQGFTIVELLIVIVVIGILALLVITTYSGIQSKARDAKRQSDLKSLQTQIEAFFSQNGYYPSQPDLNSSTWRATNMKSLDQNALVDPSESGSCLSANTCLGNSSTAVAKQYQYYATESNGTTVCTTGDQSCAQYTLTAQFENTVNGSTTDVLKNLD